MPAKYSSLVTDKLYSHAVANFAAQISTVETDESLTANSLVRPVKYFKGLAPDINIFPIHYSYVSSLQIVDSRNKMWEFVGHYALRLRATSIEVGQKTIEYYNTALIDLVYADFTLGDTTGKIVDARPTKSDTMFAALGSEFDSDLLMVCVVDIAGFLDMS